jgi:hypothetical protein
MGTLLVGYDDVRRLLPLASTNLVGRSSACLAQVAHPTCPAHWLELRWTGAGWAWRALAAPDRTRGSGRPLPDGWTSMDVEDDRGTRISLGSDVFVELVDAGPPEPFAWDVLKGEPIDGPALEEVAEVRGDQLLPLSAEGDERQALADGACWVHTGAEGPRTLRAHVPTVFAATSASRIDLCRGDVFVLVDLGEQRATFRQGAVVVNVQGACVRTLVVYGNARDDGEGWLSAAEAWAAWTELGAHEDRPLDAVGWERARLRQRLDRARVGGLDRLFETRKEGAFVKTRLGPGIEIDVVG